MRKLIGTLVVLGVFVLAIGYFRGWFSVSKDNGNEKTNISIEVDKNKIKQDANAAKEKLNQMTE